MKQSYIFMTDSNSGIPYQWEEEYDIKALYMPYTIQNKEYFYDLGRTADDIQSFYQLLREGEKSHTTQRNVIDFKDFWRPFLENGQDVLYVGFSSLLSGTFSCACMAREEMLEEFPDRKICLVDSLAISAPLALIVLHCAKMRLEGKTIEETALWAEENKQRANAFFTVEDLVYLKRGGRVSNAAAFFGTLLEVKPILYISEEGKLIPFEKIKGRKKALRRLTQIAAQNIEDLENAVILVAHADAPKEANEIRQQLIELCNPKEVLINHVGPVLGGHTGPGTIAIGFIGKTRKQAFESAK